MCWMSPNSASSIFAVVARCAGELVEQLEELLVAGEEAAEHGAPRVERVNHARS